jgi:mannosyltransferase
MDENDQTALLPRQRLPGDLSDAPRMDRWEAAEPPVVGVAWVDSSIGRERALSRLAWVFSSIVAGCLGLARPSWPGLGVAELPVWGLAGAPWQDAVRLLRLQEAADAPYHLMIRGWAELAGTSEFALRVPSVLAMSATAGVTAAVANGLVGPKAGFLAGMFVAVLPTTSRYAQEAGPQALAVLAGTFATLALVRLFDRTRFSRFAIYAGAVALLGLAHPAALVLLVAHAVAVLVMRRSVALAWTAAALAGAAPAAAVLALAGPWRTTYVGLTPSIVDIAAAVFGVLLLAGVMVGLALLGASLGRPGLVVTMWAVVPLAAAYPALRFTGYPLSLFAVLTIPAWACLAALALDRSPAVRGIVAVTVVAALGVPMHLDVRRPDGHGFASGEAGRLISAQAATGDVLVFGATLAEARLGRDVVARYVPAGRRPRDVLAVRPSRAGGQPDAQECTDVAACLAGAPRVWLIRAGAPGSPLDGMPAAKDGALRVSYRATGVWRLRGLTVYLLTRA